MDFFDFIKELRTGKPDIIKTEKAMKILAWICIAGGIWNFSFYFIAQFEKSLFNLPPQYPFLALISLLLIAVLFFRAARGIKEMESWGKKTGQIAIVLLIGVFLGFMIAMFPAKTIPLHDTTFSIFFIIFAAIFFAQLALPAYFGIRYLARLPVKDMNYVTRQYQSMTKSATTAERINTQGAVPQMTYKEALVPFGLIGSFIIILVSFFLIMFIIEKYAGMEFMPFIFIPFFLLIFIGPIVYNYIPSSFQAKRDIVASFTGGGSIFLFHGSWPFFRLMVYKDGLEVRFMFHRFFIPYDKMANIPDKVGFFNRGILIKSDLPDVPSGIRFVGFGMNKILEVVNKAKSNYLAGINKG
jgi:hypothetical protein